MGLFLGLLLIAASVSEALGHQGGIIADGVSIFNTAATMSPSIQPTRMPTTLPTIASSAIGPSVAPTLAPTLTPQIAETPWFFKNAQYNVSFLGIFAAVILVHVGSLFVEFTYREYKMRQLRAFLAFVGFMFFFLNAFITLSSRFNYLMTYKDDYIPMMTAHEELVWIGRDYLTSTPQSLRHSHCPFSLDNSQVSGLTPTTISCHFGWHEYPLQSLLTDTQLKVAIVLQLLLWLMIQLAALCFSENGIRRIIYASVNEESFQSSEQDDLNKPASHDVAQLPLPTIIPSPPKPERYVPYFEASHRRFGAAFYRLTCIIIQHKMFKYAVVIFIQSQQFCVLMALTNWEVNGDCARPTIPGGIKATDAMCRNINAAHALPFGVVALVACLLCGTGLTFFERWEHDAIESATATNVSKRESSAIHSNYNHSEKDNGDMDSQMEQMLELDTDMGNTTRRSVAGRTRNASSGDGDRITSSITRLSEDSMPDYLLLWKLPIYVCFAGYFAFGILFLALSAYYFFGGFVLGLWMEFGSLSFTSSLVGCEFCCLILYLFSDMGQYVLDQRDVGSDSKSSNCCKNIDAVASGGDDDAAQLHQLQEQAQQYQMSRHVQSQINRKPNPSQSLAPQNLPKVVPFSSTQNTSGMSGMDSIPGSRLPSLQVVSQHVVSQHVPSQHVVSQQAGSRVVSQHMSQSVYSQPAFSERIESETWA